METTGEKHTDKIEEGKIVIELNENDFMLYYSNTLSLEHVYMVLYAALDYMDRIADGEEPLRFLQ